MIELTNQTIYQCEHCGRRMLSKNGARIHETEYCKAETSPHMIAVRKRQAECQHENAYDVWSPIPGEPGRSEPDYWVCEDCEITQMEFMKSEMEKRNHE